MSTEYGVPHPRAAAGMIDALRERRDYLAEQIETKHAAGLPAGFSEREHAALSWALPVLEAEHGTIVRLWRDVLGPAERLVAHATEQEQRQHFGRHAFVSDVADEGVALVKRHCAECGVQFARHAGARRPEHEREGATA